MSQDDSAGYRPLRKGGGPRPRRPQPGLLPTTRHDTEQAKRGLRDWRGAGWLLGLGLIFALGPFLRGWVELATGAMEGDGYVRWRYPAWKAKQSAEKHNLPLVIVRVDQETEAYDRFRQRVLAHPSLQGSRGHGVWLRADPPKHGPPELGIYHSDGATEWTEPLPLTDVDPAALASELRDYDASR